jgi:hypothetical protein
MQNQFTEGVLRIRIGVPFTLREIAGPWSWIANRYYWFVFDEVMTPHYRQLVHLGSDPVAEIMEPATRRLAGNVELVLDRTQLAFRISGASSGSVNLKVNGVWKALKCLASWLPVYGAWLQNKGRIDLRAEIERSAALVEISNNFESFGMPPDTARRMALQRLYSSWPDFYAEASRGIEAAMTFEPPQRKRRVLIATNDELGSLATSIPSNPALERVNTADRTRRKRLLKS